ncbi:hypothetical protein [Glaciibacter psychrotolerans]|uniref:Transmembrane protein n=1 Tax=Glaciibacter psychrotolerans TaxID=670054 RepID=A0A7Z0J576_9MICO|nr:hypothetical protein [Leifsonia psychrotolerans]NYJ18619.1 hypothetical protein [Leifsonia psychrotolerans]
MDASLLSIFLPIVVVGIIGGFAAWVLCDARSHEHDDRPVVATFFGWTVDRSSTWAALCLVLFVAAFPLYLVARRESD